MVHPMHDASKDKVVSSRLTFGTRIGTLGYCCSVLPPETEGRNFIVFFPANVKIEKEKQNKNKNENKNFCVINFDNYLFLTQNYNVVDIWQKGGG